MSTGPPDAPGVRRHLAEKRLLLAALQPFVADLALVRAGTPR
ncbi:hypothetical protein ACI799_08085 [Blastococcus sp. SYSU DS0753]